MLLVEAGQHCRASRCKKGNLKHYFLKFNSKKEPYNNNTYVMNILSFGEPEFDYKKQDQGSTEKHFCKYI